jgi:hypothetical protein
VIEGITELAARFLLLHPPRPVAGKVEFPT